MTGNDTSAICRQLEENERHLWNELVMMGARRHYPPGRILYLQGTPNEGLFCILRGKVKNSIFLKNGTEIILTLYHENTIISEVASLNHWQNISTATAQTAVEVSHITPDKARGIIEKHPALALYLFESVGKKLRTVTMQLSELAGKRIAENLATTLLAIGDYGVEQSPDGGWLYVTHDELARIVCTTRPNITTILNGFVQKGFIEAQRGRIHILDREALRNFSECDNAK